MASCKPLECVQWVEGRCKRVLTEFQARVAVIIDAISSGVHNAPVRWETVDWEYGFGGMSVVWTRGTLASFDFCNLTTLVMLCHDARIRVQIEPSGPKALRLSFHQREHTGSVGKRHPDLDEAFASHREWVPENHPIHYRHHFERQESDS